jgi:hypothetical protein
VAPIPRSCFPGQQESDGTSRGVQLLLSRRSELHASALLAMQALPDERAVLSDFVPSERESGPGWSRPRAAVNSPRLRFPVVLSLRGAHLLGGRLFIALVSHPLEALALELGGAIPKSCGSVA